MPSDREWDIQYWTKRLGEIKTRILPYREKLYDTCAVPFTIEENYQVRAILMDATIVIEFLETAVSKPEPPLTIKQYIKSRRK